MRNAKILAAGLLALALLTGCGAMQAAEPVSITFMHGWGGSGRDHTAMRQIYADFEKANPDISVVYDTSPDITVVMQKANDMLAADKAPDFISTNGSTQYVSNAIRKNLALDLTPELEADPAFAADVADSTLEALRQPDGAVYTLPDAVEYIGYWYNEALFREAGVTDTGTPEGTVEPPATWEEFWRACDKLAAAEKKTGAAPMRMELGQLSVLLGARLAAEDGGARAFMQGRGGGCPEQTVQDAVSDLRRAVAYNPDGAPTALDARQAFFDGRSAIYLNGVWANTEVTETALGKSIRYAAFPGADGQSVSFLNPTTGYVVGSAGSEEQRAACLRFLKYMLSENVQKRLVLETGQAPSSPKLSIDWIESEVPALGGAIRVCTQADVQIRSVYSVLSAKDGAALDDCLASLLQGNDETQPLIRILAENPSAS